MIFKQNNGYTLWGKAHPGKCEGCAHGYHVMGGNLIKGFNTYPEAEDYYCQQSGADKFLFGSGKPFNS